MTPDVSVIVPTHDRRELLAWTLGSILSQRGAALEVVVVDDASADGTVDWLTTLDDDRVRVVARSESGGAAVARNDGLAHARAPWVAFCDDDDLWAPHKLVMQLERLEREPDARWCVGGAVCVDEALQVVDVQRMPESGDVLGSLLVANSVPGGGSGVLASAELVRDAGGFRAAELSSEDWDLWIRLAALAPLAVVDSPLVAYRVWAGGKSRKVVRMAAAYRTIQERYADLAAEHGVQPEPSAHDWFLARQAVRGGERWQAARLYAGLAARTSDPSHLVRAGAALVAPARYDRLAARRAIRAAAPDWVDDSRRWIAAIAPHEHATGDAVSS